MHLILQYGNVFANGGGTCYVISIGNYEKNLSDVYTDKSKETIFSNIKKVQDITMLVVPEAVNVDTCMNIYTDLLNLCDSKSILFFWIFL